MMIVCGIASIASAESFGRCLQLLLLVGSCKHGDLFYSKLRIAHWGANDTLSDYDEPCLTSRHRCFASERRWGAAQGDTRPTVSRWLAHQEPCRATLGWEVLYASALARGDLGRR